MKFSIKFYLAVALMIVAAAPVAAQNYSQVCNTCLNEQDYTLFAEQWGQTRPAGYYELVILNDTTNQVWHSSVNVEWMSATNKMVHAFSYRGDQQSELAFVDFKTFFQLASDGIHVMMPDDTAGIGGDSFRLSTNEAVGYAVNLSPEFAEFVKDNFYGDSNIMHAIWNGVAMLMSGDVPQLVIIYLNGDVAVFEVRDPRGGPLCCTYVAGTARDSNGDILDSSGGGTGGSYVTPVPGGFRITWNDIYVVCSRVGDGPWTCKVQDE